MEEIILLVLEIVGTIAFAVSGAFVAIKAKLDVFGVLFVGCITAVGGGITRDLLMGCTPPAIFSNLYILLIAAVTSAVVFVLSYIKRKRFHEIEKRIEHINNVFDACGLAAFSVMGTQVAFAEGFGNNAVFAILMGMLTGVFGGVYRDILTATTPYIFKKHVYALASIGGAMVYYVLRVCIGGDNGTLIASIVAMGLVVTIRMLAAKYRWSLPKVHLEEAALDEMPQEESEKLS